MRELSKDDLNNYGVEVYNYNTEETFLMTIKEFVEWINQVDDTYGARLKPTKGIAK